MHASSPKCILKSLSQSVIVILKRKSLDEKYIVLSKFTIAHGR